MTEETIIEYPSINGIRDLLSTKLYVEHLQKNNVMYDLGTQEILNEDEKDFPEYVICYENGEFIAKSKRENRMVRIYAILRNTTEAKPVYGYVNGDMSNLKEIRIYEEMLDTVVDVYGYVVFEKDTMNVQNNILFNMEWKPECRFIMLNNILHHVGFMDKPWVYNPDLNDLKLTTTRIVLPYITDEDVEEEITEEETKTFIQFFDKDNESVNEWQCKSIEEWKPKTNYKYGDVFSYNDVVYIVTRFEGIMSQSIFNTEGMRLLTQREIDDYTKPTYFPCMVESFSIPRSNILALKEVNTEENRGHLLTDKKFIFYELSFTPLYNKNIDNFTISFYNHNQDNIPEFQLI